MKEELLKIKQEVIDAVKNIKDSDELESLKTKYLGRKQGVLTNALKNIKDLSVEQKKEIGQLANQVKQDITELLAADKKDVEARLIASDFDKTLPGIKPSSGNIHPLHLVRLEVEEIFRSMGFQVHEGNELTNLQESFLSLNFPEDHPAMDDYDTFYIKGSSDKLMRPHTSNMQVQLMSKQKPPVKVIVPGRCFRNEATDASHEHTFHQLEGFVVDKNITIANLIWTQKKLLSNIFKKDVKVRLRPGYFPFVEPGFELDCSCLICGGKGCSVCKKTGWVELIPCGMIHPQVLKNAGYSEEYTGFAFGMGWSRLAMMKYNIDDIRHFMSGDLRFLKQF